MRSIAHEKSSVVECSRHRLMQRVTPGDGAVKRVHVLETLRSTRIAEHRPKHENSAGDVATTSRPLLGQLGLNQIVSEERRATLAGTAFAQPIWRAKALLARAVAKRLTCGQSQISARRRLSLTISWPSFSGGSMVQKSAFGTSILSMSGMLAASSLCAAEAPLPAATSPQFCIVVQQKLAATEMVGENTIFADMPSYRHSKPAIKPLKIFQVVTYDKQMPIVASCKMKTAAHLREVYGAQAAGRQLFCPDMALMMQKQAIDELTSEGQAEAAARLSAFIVDRDAPFVTGQAYLNDFRTIYRAADGTIHVSSPGLYQDTESWYTPLLPEFLKGQSYCHLATVDYLKAVATAAMAPGTTITTGDDAPTQPFAQANSR